MSHINDLPNEVLEFIMSLLAPYKDLKNCSLVCNRWNELVKNVVHHKKIHLHRGLAEFRLCWKHQFVETDFKPPAGRFSHCSVVVGSEMFVFGGASSTVTTFNDLWKFDLSKRDWTRMSPISSGSYPSPKAYATMVSYKDSLILLGGWRHSSAHSPYQSCSLFEELHIYTIAENRWVSHNSMNNSPPAFAGHSATVQRDQMVVFGGYEKNVHGAHGISNEVWLLDLVSMCWRKPQIASIPKPKPRYGQFQVNIDDHHILIMGGCGGPNSQYSDAWLLNTQGAIWKWRSVQVKNKDYSATHMWCNPSCLVDDKLVVLGPMPTVPSDLQILKHQLSQPHRNGANERSRMHERQQRFEQQREQLRNHAVEEVGNRGNEVRDNNNGRQPVKVNPVNKTNGFEHRDTVNNNDRDGGGPPVPRPPQRSIQIRPINDDLLPKRFNEIYAPANNHLGMAAFSVPPTNQVHLERARRMEEKIAKIYANRKSVAETKKNEEQVASNNRNNFVNPSANTNKTPTAPLIRQNSIAIFICDLSNVIAAVGDDQQQAHSSTAAPTSTGDPSISWLAYKNFGVAENSPERLIMSTLVKGNGELIMFGGLQKESMNEVNEAINISNALYILSVPCEII